MRRDPEGAEQFSLSPAEIAFFKANGYIVKRGLVPEADLAPYREQFWRGAASVFFLSHFSRFLSQFLSHFRSCLLC